MHGHRGALVPFHDSSTFGRGFKFQPDVTHVDAVDKHRSEFIGRKIKHENIYTECIALEPDRIMNYGHVRYDAMDLDHRFPVLGRIGSSRDVTTR